MMGADMEESYKLEKEYKVPVDTFSEAYLAFQKKILQRIFFFR